jgi:hypothetical protein
LVTQASAEETTEEGETYLAGYEPGRGSAHNYIPEWMEIPRLNSGEKQDDPLAVVKLFTPDSSWTWYITEYDGQDTCFGLVVGFETELGYFSISEIAGVKGPLGLRIERDLWFRPVPITQLRDYQAEWGEHGGPYKGTPDASQDQDYVSLPDPWTVEDIAFLVEKLEGGPILVADSKLGLPT